MSKTPTKPLIIPPHGRRRYRHHHAALADPSAQPLTDEQLAAMVPYTIIVCKPTATAAASCRLSAETNKSACHTIAEAT
jgi:hypothetical protein